MLQLRLEPMRVVVAMRNVWDFLETYVAEKGRSLSRVAMVARVHELYMIWQSGAAIPYLNLEELRRLEEAAGLTRGVLEVIAELGDTIDAEEMSGLARAFVKRDGAVPGPKDLISMLEVIRNPVPKARSLEMSDCWYCDTPYTGRGRCPECHHPR